MQQSSEELREVGDSWTVLEGLSNLDDGSPRISPSIMDYDLSADSLASEIAKMNRLITDFNGNLQKVVCKIESLDDRLSIFEEKLSGAMEHIEEDRRVRTELAADLRGTVDTMTKIKPLVKSMSKRIEDMEARDLRQTNWNIRRGIPFNFKPHHRDGDTTGMMRALGVRTSLGGVEKVAAQTEFEVD